MHGCAEAGVVLRPELGAANGEPESVAFGTVGVRACASWRAAVRYNGASNMDSRASPVGVRPQASRSSWPVGAWGRYRSSCCNPLPPAAGSSRVNAGGAFHHFANEAFIPTQETKRGLLLELGGRSGRYQG